MKNYFLLLIISILVIASCTDDGDTDIGTTTYDVDPTFEPYVQEFIAEGSKRGHDIDFSDTGLRIEFSDTAIEGASGLCFLGEHHIIINKENWFRFSERFRSFLLFHELGHCELDRLHRNEQFDDLTWKSILRGSPLTGIQNRFPVTYFGFRKDYYIDELFDTNTPDPEWSKVQFDYNETFNRNNLTTIEDVNRLNERYTTSLNEYELEADFTLPTTANTITRVEWGANDLNYYLYVLPGWGYYVGVTLENLDNDIFYDNNTTLFNGKPIEKITIRQKDDVTQIFINEQFVFHLDALPALEYYQLGATSGSTFDTTFDIERFELNELE